MSYDEDGWIPLTVEMIDRLGPIVGADCIESVQNASFSGEPWAGALFILEGVEATNEVIELDFLDRLAEWFLHKDEEPEDPFVEPLREVFGILRERAINSHRITYSFLEPVHPTMGTRVFSCSEHG